jgi:hypothetical protein
MREEGLCQDECKNRGRQNTKQELEIEREIRVEN